MERLIQNEITSAFVARSNPDKLATGWSNKVTAAIAQHHTTDCPFTIGELHSRTEGTKSLGYHNPCSSTRATNGVSGPDQPIISLLAILSKVMKKMVLN